MAMTKRELHRRIAAARDEAAAMIFFRMVDTKSRKRGKDALMQRYANDQAIKGLVAIVSILTGGEFDTAEGDCGACGKPIRGGQKYVYTEDADNFHATKKCWGKLPKHIHRAETERERYTDARRQLSDARAYLKKRGMIT